MRKRILYFLILLLAGLVSLYYWRYFTTPCYCGVTANATAIVHIDLRSVEKSYVDNFILNPLSYFSKRDKNTKNDAADIATLTGNERLKLTEIFKFPRSIFFSAQDDDRAQWVSNGIGIKDEQMMVNYLTENGFSREKGLYRNGSIAIQLWENKVYLSIGTPYHRMIKDSMQWMKKKAPLLQKLQKSKGSITYVDKQDQYLELIGRKGELKVKGSFDLLFLQSSSVSVEGMKQNYLSASFNKRIIQSNISERTKENFVDFTKVNLDSILSFWEGNIQALVQSPKFVTDTIITYEYDDDFNKVAIAKTKEKIQPRFTVQMDISLDGVEYLKSKNAIVDKEGNEILAIFPLVTTYIKPKGNQIQLYTDDPKDIVTQPSENKLNVNLDFQELGLDSLSLLPKYEQWIQKISSLQCVIGNNNSIDLSIQFDSNKNGLLLMFQ